MSYVSDEVMKSQGLREEAHFYEQSYLTMPILLRQQRSLLCCTLSQETLKGRYRNYDIEGTSTLQLLDKLNN